jgi:hypothetical protein
MVKMLVREQELLELCALRQGAGNPLGHAHGGIYGYIAVCRFDKVAIASHGTTGVYLNLSAHARILPAFTPFGEPKVRQYEWVYIRAPQRFGTRGFTIDESKVSGLRR